MTAQPPRRLKLVGTSDAKASCAAVRKGLSVGPAANDASISG
jgi:hypothetical protein